MGAVAVANAAVYDDVDDANEAACTTPLPLLLLMIDKSVASISIADDDGDDADADELMVIIDLDRLPLRLLEADIISSATTEAMFNVYDMAGR